MRPEPQRGSSPVVEAGRPDVSVIVIFLDEERFLAEAIDSVRRQTFTSWELLLVDDGSTDRSPDIARAAVAADPTRVRYLTHPGGVNRGMSASRNLGVAAARGRYVAWLDGDDAWRPEKLERQLALLAQQPRARMVYGPLTLWHSWTGDVADRGRDSLFGTRVDYAALETDRLYEPPDLLRRFLRHKDLVPSGVLVERALLAEVGGAAERFRGNYEDGALLTKICLRAPVYVSSESLYLYRQHDDSFCRTERRLGHSDDSRLDFLRWCARYLRDQGIGWGRLRWTVWWTALTVRRPLVARIDLFGQRAARRTRVRLGRGRVHRQVGSSVGAIR